MKKQDDTELREAILDLRKPDKITAKRPIEAELDDLINLFTTRLASIQKAIEAELEKMPVIVMGSKDYTYLNEAETAYRYGLNKALAIIKEATNGDSSN